ncbi:RHS repeat-associated core domain-containing protein [Aeromonas salmonicida]|uniref:RHS repeat-associated core domain-containing protein n=1 Tax=Aeromonas salmonicida TaxID=645 RepID=UPI002796AE4D|nr:RHS repeat-associated core domain-containing protein [Aeromonas salmonicida]MDQ1886658.1 RHS repeat-associated core domain-containing protein [Aeromonas salmonicida]
MNNVNEKYLDKPPQNISRRSFMLRASVLATSAALLTLSPAGRALAGWAAGPGEMPEAVGRMLLQDNCLAFNGERRDPVTGLYHLGQGYRAYNPRMMRFHAADSLSPFGEGGINPYGYCLGDPINAVDPTGHSAWSWIGAIAGILIAVVGLVVGVATFGAAAPAAAAMIAGGAGITAAGIAGLAGVIGGALTVASSLTFVVSSLASSEQTKRDWNTATLVLSILGGAAGAVQGIANAAVAAAQAGQSIVRYVASTALAMIKEYPKVVFAGAVVGGAGIALMGAGLITHNEGMRLTGGLILSVVGIRHLRSNRMSLLNRVAPTANLPSRIPSPTHMSVISDGRLFQSSARALSRRATL